MKIVYLDILFLTNLIPDYLLLRLTGVILGVYTKPYRIISGALFGGLLSIPLYFMHSNMSFLIKTAFCLCLCLIVFGFKKLLLSFTVFCALSFAFCGAVYALSLLNVCGAHVKNGSVYADISFTFLCVSCVFAYCVLRLAFGQGSGFTGKKRILVTALLKGKKITFSALCDTGNALRHPFSNKRIIIAPKDLCASLLPEEAKGFLMRSTDSSSAFELLSGELSGRLSLIPFSSVNGEGLMLVLKPDELLLDGKPNKSYLLGISNSKTEALIGV